MYYIQTVTSDFLGLVIRNEEGRHLEKYLQYHNQIGTCFDFFSLFLFVLLLVIFEIRKINEKYGKNYVVIFS